MKTFWLSWADKKISIGKGITVDKQILVSQEHTETLTDITSVSFDTFKNEPGRWDFKAFNPTYGENLGLPLIFT